MIGFADFTEILSFEEGLNEAFRSRITAATNDKPKPRWQKSIGAHGGYETSAQHGGHSVMVQYVHRPHLDANYSSERHPEGTYGVDFYTDGRTTGSGEHISSEHKAHLMRHLGRSFDAFMKTKKHKEKSVVFKAHRDDPDYERKNNQYRQMANTVARKYGGTPTEPFSGEHHVSFAKKDTEKPAKGQLKLKLRGGK